MINKLIFSINGAYYSMEYPILTDLLQMFLYDGDPDIWKEAKGQRSYTEQRAARHKMDYEFTLKKIRMTKWITDPFPLFGKEYHAFGAIVLSRGIGTPFWKYPVDEGAELFKYMEDKKTLKMVNFLCDPFGVRPVLNPFSLSLNCSISQDVMKTASNGTVVKMGTFYLDGKPVSPNIASRMVLDQNADFCIDDTYEPAYALEWMYWNGRLYPTNNLFQVKQEDLIAVMGLP